MEKNYTERKYLQAREKINNLRQNNFTWDQIKLNGKANHEDFINSLKDEFLNKLDETDWLKLVELAKINEEKSKDINIGPISIPSKQNNKFEVPTRPTSMWQSYRQKLTDNGFLEEDIENLEKSCIKTLNYLKNQTEPHKPIKGMIVGNVQSGKTSNMTALMAMASDYGWNMFIILSGTIDNLREQTQDRFDRDLQSNTAIKFFKVIKNLKEEKISSIDFSSESRQCNLIVCLKNSKRLQDLLIWLNKDKSKKAQIKLLVIDDEADQASINTAKIEKKEKTQINRLISYLVYDYLYSKKSKEPICPESNFCSLNYIGYTATPYANFLNEGPSTFDDPLSLFPEDFIGVLKNSSEYIGPQQIFGIDSYEGLNIINIFGSNTDKANYALIKGNSSLLPDSLKDAIHWFYCCLAIFRFKKKNSKNISMLINLSHKTDSHDFVYEAIKQFIHNSSLNNFVNDCLEVYKNQTSSLTRDDFLNVFPNYADGELEVDDYPSFEDIKPYLIEIFNGGIEPVSIDKETKAKKYIKGVQISIDNGNYNTNSKDEKEFRIEYPEEQEHPNFATGFIVIGGQTLSRGLTLQGLVTTYFARKTRQGDTLMQMGRWFGYRVGYELLPRIWMSRDNCEKFTYLSRIDLHLKKYIEEFSKTNRKPRDYGVRVLNTPYPSWMVLTAKNKMQHAVKVRLDFSDCKYQTTNFFNDKNKLQSNIEETRKFVDQLKNIENVEVRKEGSKSIFSNIPSQLILSFLSNLSYPNDNNEYIDVPQFKQWCTMITNKKLLTSWNVVFGGLVDSPYGVSNELGIDVSRVGRAKSNNDDTEVFSLGAIRDQNDLFVDIPKDIRDKFQPSPKTMKDIDQLRKNSGYGSTPELIVYLIAKDSKPDSRRNVKTLPLNAPVDLVGIALNIPAGDIKKDFSEEITVDLTKYKESMEEEDND